MQRYAVIIYDTHPHPSSFSSFITQAHIHGHAHTCTHPALERLLTANTYNAPKRPQERKEGEEGRAWGRGSGGDIASPVRTMCGAGQRKDGGWDKGRKGRRCRGVFEEREAIRMLEAEMNGRRCEDAKPEREGQMAHVYKTGWQVHMSDKKKEMHSVSRFKR